MTPTAYYNEIDPFAAAWLRELIKAGHIAPGEVDERSIEDVKPDELRAFTQCHFFAGIGVWSYALRMAGWPDDRPVWTGSCPCQPFSTAGKRTGTADERHLWPALYHLAQQCKPATLFGEQVASKDGLAWFETVQADLESQAYTVGAVDLCAAGFGAPIRRQRLYIVAQSSGPRLEGQSGAEHKGQESRWNGTREGRPTTTPSTPSVESPSLDAVSLLRRMDLHNSQSTRSLLSVPTNRRLGNRSVWDDCEALPCRDGWRMVEPGTFPLAHGATNRVGRLRGYGNSLVAPVATAFIEAFLETERGGQ